MATPLKHIGTVKIANYTSQISFSGVNTATSPYYVNLHASQSNATSLASNEFWRLNFRIYFRALSNGTSSAAYYGSYPYIWCDNVSSSWDRSGFYWQATNQATNTSHSGWNSSPSYSYAGAMFASVDQGQTGYWQYNYSTNTATNSLANCDAQFDHGYIDFNFGPSNKQAANINSYSIRPANNDTSSTAQIALNANYSTGGGPNATTDGPYTLYLYNGTNWAPGSTFVCYAWDSKDIN